MKPMTVPTSKEIAEAKADAKKRFGRDELLEVLLPAPISACILVAPLDLDAYGRHVDAQTRDKGTSYSTVVLERRCWPDVEPTLGLLARWPAAAKKIAQRLYVRAGQVNGSPQTEPLADLVARLPTASAGADLVEVIPGLTLAKARALLEAEAATEEPCELWGAWGPGALSCILAMPDADVWLASTAANDAARAKAERIIGSSLDFTRQAWRWGSSPIEALLDDKPSVASDLRLAYLAMGGDGVEASSKSL